MTLQTLFDSIEAVDNPLIGQRYLVRCVWGRLSKTLDPRRWWPVIGPKHSDPEISPQAGEAHWHIDWRFVRNLPRAIPGHGLKWNSATGELVRHKQ